METYTASCTCGNLAYHFSTAVPPAKWPVRKCSCSFCTARDPLYTSDPDGSVRFECADAAQVEKHRFATGTADFVSCRQCRAYMGAVMASDDGTYAVLNIKWITQSLDLGEPETMTYDGESVDERLARRFQRWTPVIGDV